MSSESSQVAATRIDAYDVGDAVPVEGFESVSAGTNLLVSGGRMLGKQRLALGLLAAGSLDQHPIAISPDTGSERLQRAYGELSTGETKELHVIDCTGTSGRESTDDAGTVEYVSSPGDLTGLGMGIVKCTRRAGDVDRGLRLAMLSLSTLTRYSDPQRVFNFLHTVTGRVSAADYLGVATIDPSTQSAQELSTITSLFDVVVELRETDDGSREIRVIGDHETPRSWQPF